jgi:hypothetical protein
MNNSKTILAVVLLMAGTLLTTTAVTTMVPAAYAGRDNDDGNQQKAEDESQAALADCDENDVEQAGFDCIAIAQSEVEIEPPEESATLSVCKEITGGSSQGSEPDDFVFTVTGNGPSDDEFEGDADCVDVTIGPGEYTVSDVIPPLGGRTLDIRIQEGSDCEQDPFGGIRAIGEIEAGETQECRFINSLGD